MTSFGCWYTSLYKDLNIVREYSSTYRWCENNEFYEDRITAISTKVSSIVECCCLKLCPVVRLGLNISLNDTKLGFVIEVGRFVEAEDRVVADSLEENLRPNQLLFWLSTSDEAFADII
jgi:hypothetical protein